MEPLALNKVAYTMKAVLGQADNSHKTESNITWSAIASAEDCAVGKSHGELHNLSMPACREYAYQECACIRRSMKSYLAKRRA